ncbi:MAG: hypothetical protein GXP41_07995 [Chloroflexi bacterium]|nr:hypothetical protein [Chloroflexota bacterium]
MAGSVDDSQELAEQPETNEGAENLVDAADVPPVDMEAAEESGVPAGDVEQPQEAEASEGSSETVAIESESEEAATPAEDFGSAAPDPDSEYVEPTGGADVITEQDKLVAFLGYIIGFLVPAIVLLSVDMRERRYQRVHAMQSLGLWSASVVFYAALALMDVVLMQIPCLGWLLACISLPLFLLPPVLIFYYALLASQGREFEIPVLSEAMRDQGWL